MTIQTTNTAREYCQTIECELIALETILKCDTKWHASNDEELLEAYAELEFENTGEAAEAVYQWINETLLEFKLLRTDDRTHARIEMLRTCGGPYCEITRNTNDGQIIAVTTYDGAQQATTRNTYPHLSQFLDELAG